MPEPEEATAPVVLAQPEAAPAPEPAAPETLAPAVAAAAVVASQQPPAVPAPAPQPAQAPPSAPPPAAPPQAAPPQAAAPAGQWAPTQAQGKSRPIAIVLALFLGFIGIHKFYLGKVAQGIIYVIFSWTGIPAFVAWIEAILYLLTSNEAWAAKWGGPVERPSGGAIGCLWILALLPLISFVAIFFLVVLGAGVASVTS